MPTSCTPRGAYSRLSARIRSSTACTYGQGLQMNITTRTGLSRKSSREYPLPAAEGSRHALGVGAGAPEHAQALEQLPVVSRSPGVRGRGPHRTDEIRERRTTAEVARRTAGRDRLVEVGDEPLVPAARCLGKLVHRHALTLRLAAEVGVLDALLDPSVAEHVGPGVEQDAVALEAVAARAADLLVVALDRTGHLAVDHVTDVRLVDAHPEGDRRHHDVDLVAREGVLVPRPHVVLEPGVVRHGAHPGGAEELGQ